jgi:predicted nucleotidyltransferase
MAADERFRGALRALARALNDISNRSMIIGGVAVIAAGVPRETVDIDAIVPGRETDVQSVVNILGRHGIVPRIGDALSFARERQVLLLHHVASGVPIEISFGWLPFEEEAFDRAAVIDFEGLTLRVARPEDLIVYKAAAWRDRDRSDIERLLALHIDRIDLRRVRHLIDQIGEALDDPGRIIRFDEMVADVRGGEESP